MTSHYQCTAMKSSLETRANVAVLRGNHNDDAGCKVGIAIQWTDSPRGQRQSFTMLD